MTKESNKPGTIFFSPNGEVSQVRTANLGFPRIGANRELKRALESFWKGDIAERSLVKTAQNIRRQNWMIQKSSGIDTIPSNDFSLYDPMLDLICMLGAVPERFNHSGGPVSLRTYFAMARGFDAKKKMKTASARAMDMTKWFDTNYHYIVPELGSDTHFRPCSTKALDEFREALDLGIKTRPVLIGPVTFLMLGKATESGFETLSLLDRLLPVYIGMLKSLAGAGADWVQLDEPILALDTDVRVQAAIRRTCDAIAREVPQIRICLTTYFEAIGGEPAWIAELPVSALHVDLVRGPHQLTALLSSTPPSLGLSLGVVDGRNIWKNDLSQTLRILREILSRHPQRELWIAPSCSLSHVPLDLTMESSLDPLIASWMSYAVQKLSEVQILRKALSAGDASVQSDLDTNRAAMESRRKSPRTRVNSVRDRIGQIGSREYRRGPGEERRRLQRTSLKLPLYPTTTIGSFPQTDEVRKARAAYKAGKLSEEKYRSFLKDQIREAVQIQEKLGLDVLVHGEFERADMVEYFGERLEGFAFTQHGWVQSYGSRCVKPPVIYGDVVRRREMTVEWFKFAQSLTKRPMKGMLTGPVTMMQWSFVRDDQPKSQTALQLALAIRDEAADLEKAGAKIIQIDEAAFREGLPLKISQRADYLQWSVQAFRLASGSVHDHTQVHTHMCYSEFQDILPAIHEMNVDVISVETSRSHRGDPAQLVRIEAPIGVGPGVYDIHSPRVPTASEISRLLQQTARVLPAERIWVNPDCGLKTRRWSEVLPALKVMVAVAKKQRVSGAARRGRRLTPGEKK